MESESDTENEQLQHDILQINEVLGQGEDEGDDSDWELEIDDTTKAADDDHSIGTALTLLRLFPTCQISGWISEKFCVHVYVG